MTISARTPPQGVTLVRTSAKQSCSLATLEQGNPHKARRREHLTPRVVRPAVPHSADAVHFLHSLVDLLLFQM
jgi:hypothetical protein